MIPLHLQKSLDKNEARRTYNEVDERAILRSLRNLRIAPTTELGEFLLEFNPSMLWSHEALEQLQDVMILTADGSPAREDWETPLESATRVVREGWELPDNLICLTSTEGEGGYLYDLKSGAIYDFDLGRRAEL